MFWYTFVGCKLLITKTSCFATVGDLEKAAD